MKSLALQMRFAIDLVNSFDDGPLLLLSSASVSISFLRRVVQKQGGASKSWISRLPGSGTPRKKAPQPPQRGARPEIVSRSHHGHADFRSFVEGHNADAP